MIALSRKKREASSGENAPWLATFADLMNLLLCFFIMLFSMSEVNGVKFRDVSISLSNSFGIFEGGGTAVGDGQLISSGASQLNNLGEYFSNMGESSNKTSSKDIEKQSNVSDDGSNKDAEQNNKSESNEQSKETKETKEIIEVNEAMKKIQKQKMEASAKMYDKLSDFTDKYNLGDDVALGIDPDYQFIQLTLNGSVLFESGDALIKDEAKPILSRIGDILKGYEGYEVEIEGHTDNVPMSNNNTYKDNNWLSSARALNAAEYLIEKKHIDAQKLKYSGRGEYEPIASNATDVGRAKNRRIVIKIYNKYSRK